MKRSKIVIAKITSLEDEYHKLALDAFAKKYPIFAAPNDPEPMLIGVIGHFRENGDLKGYYSFYPQPTKVEPKNFNFFSDYNYFDKFMFSGLITISAFSMWFQMVSG